MVALGRDEHSRSLSIVQEVRLVFREYGQRVFGGASVGWENALEVLLQHLHPLDAENNIASPLAMGKI